MYLITHKLLNPKAMGPKLYDHHFISIQHKIKVTVAAVVNLSRPEESLKGLEHGLAFTSFLRKGVDVPVGRRSQ